MTEPVWVELSDGPTTWRVDADFLASEWTCIWDRGCAGIGEVADPAGGLGCCSVGAQMADDDEAMRIASEAAFLTPDLFEHHDHAAEHGVFRDDARSGTSVVDGACVFLNRPGFSGGHGCALHLAAVADDERPIDRKPAVCWQLPLRVEEHRTEDGTDEVVVRSWRRADFGVADGEVAWMCSHDRDPDAFVGTERVVDSLSEELVELMGPKLHRRLRDRVGG